MTLLFSDEFSDGPYGTGYFDIAGPFIVPDLSVAIQGDANLDENINIQDIVLSVGLVLQYLKAQHTSPLFFNMSF